MMLLCTDGLCGPVTDEEISRIVLETPDLPTASNRLVEAANVNGGPDNVTCVLARWIQ
jgi:protein phosphatase